MPEPTDGGSKEFTTLLKGCRSIEDLKLGKYTNLRGPVYRGTEPNTFAIATADGNLVEMENAAVDRFKVVGSGLHPEIEISVSSEALRTAKATVLKPVVADGPITFAAADHKLVAKDVRTDPIADKLVVKDVITDPIHTYFSDPIGGTAAETVVEGGGFDPGAGVINPAFAGSAGMTPFVMATPHQASAAAINMQMAAVHPAAGIGASATTAKEVALETAKEPVSDTIKEAAHDTVKELPLDTRKEIVVDTTKELIETTFEGGGTFQEGGGFPGNGGFPGMPGF